MKNISEAFLEALKLISVKFEEHNIKWMIVGSTSLALQDVDVEPRDIDILTNKDGALKSNEILKEFLIESVIWSESEIYKSYFGKFRFNDVLIDVMGEFSVYIQGKWLSLASRLKNIHYIKVKDLKIPVTRLKDHLKISKNSALKKDRERHELILKRLK